MQVHFAKDMKVSTGEFLIQLLEAYDVDIVFGIPGVHTVELYGGLAGSRIRHVTPRHEQGAGFMADGYARMSGMPGVCLVITGPGLSNIATAMLQARADSIPMLVISGVNNPDRSTRGNLHEMPDQSAFARTVAVKSFTAASADDIAVAIHSAFTLFSTARPGPVHIEIPLSLMQIDCSAQPIPDSIKIPAPPQPSEEVVNDAQDAINEAGSVIVLAGGGTRGSGAEVIALAERLNAAVITTANARTHIPTHPLVIQASASLKPLRQLIQSADLVIAVGTELGSTDYDVYETEGPLRIKCLVRIDIDKRQLSANHIADFNLQCLAKDGIKALLPGLDNKEDKPEVNYFSKEIQAELSDDYQQLVGLLKKLRGRIEKAVFVGDSTQLIYAGNLAFAPSDGGAWFNSSVGFGTLGYALSAAIGAKLARPDLPVICLIGDGGLQFTLSELGTLEELGLPMVIVVWNNQGYGEIREFMKAKGVKPEGVDLAAPDFCTVATAYRLNAERACSAMELVSLVAQAVSRADASLIDVSINDHFEY